MNLPPFLPLLLRLLHITATALDQEGGTSIPSESHRREEDVDGTGDFKGGTDLEREALVALYESTGGLTEGWGGWKEDGGWLEGDPCEDAWFGVTCDSVTGSVTELNLASNLSLYWNDLTGTIPTEIGNLQGLEKLNLDYNDQFGRERLVPSYAPQP